MNKSLSFLFRCRHAVDPLRARVTTVPGDMRDNVCRRKSNNLCLLFSSYTQKKKEECLPVWMEREICCRSNRFRLRPIRWVCIQSWRQGAYLCCPNSDNHVGWFHCCTSSHKITRRRCNLSCFILLQHNCFQEIRSLLKWKHVSTDRHLSKETNACVCLCLCTFCKHRWT